MYQDAKGDVSSDEEAAKAQQPPIKKKGRRRRQRQSIAVQPEAKYKKIDSDEGVFRDLSATVSPVL